MLCGVLSNPGSDICVVLCHGFSSNKDRPTSMALEKALNAKGLAIFRFDFYGHGESGGKFEDVTLSEAKDDVLCAIRFVKEKFSTVGLMGSSFGGNAALLAAATNPGLFVLALKAPVSDYLGKLIAQKDVEKWKSEGKILYREDKGLWLKYQFFEDAESIQGYEEVKKIAVPTLIVHGDADKIVPCEQSKKSAGLIENCRLEIIPGANHRFSKKEDFEKMLNHLVEFITSHA